MAKYYGDMDRQRMAVVTRMLGSIHHQHELVGAYANRFKANWTQAGWNLQKHQEGLYDIAWEGLRNSLKIKVRPRSPSRGRFDHLDELFDKSAAPEVTHVQKKKPQQPQQQQ